MCPIEQIYEERRVSRLVKQSCSVCEVLCFGMGWAVLVLV